MARGQKTKIPFKSNAKFSMIREYAPQRVIYTEENSVDNNGKLVIDEDGKQIIDQVATFVPRTYKDFTIKMGDLNEKPIKQFPILIRDSGEPWDLANLYLQKKFFSDSTYKEVSIDSYHSIAKGLEMFLRWLETLQLRGEKIDEYHFPEEPEERVTYRYHRFLQRMIGQIPPPIKLSTAKVRMAAVIGMYRGALEWGLFQEIPFENAPFQEKVIGIPYISSAAIRSIKYAVTTDISFYAPSSADNPETVEGGLRPLSTLAGRNPSDIADDEIDEQRVVIEQLAKYGNRTFELMCLTALETGARLQTVCTLRIEDLRRLKLKKAIKGEHRLPIGLGTNTDLKKERQLGKKGILFLPEHLVDQLLEYCDSEIAVNRRMLEPVYKDTDSNYVFLTEDGEPFYTSWREFQDQDNSTYSDRQDVRERSNAKRKTGKAVDSLIHRFRKFIEIEHPDFRHFKFHDFRATYGINFMRDAINGGKSATQAVEELRIRMSHNSVQTTYEYLDYTADIGLITKLEDGYYSVLNEKAKYDGE